jgi:hypothetical protein
LSIGIINVEENKKAKVCGRKNIRKNERKRKWMP